jgi:hypothetical protein
LRPFVATASSHFAHFLAKTAGAQLWQKMSPEINSYVSIRARQLKQVTQSEWATLPFANLTKVSQGSMNCAQNSQRVGTAMQAEQKKRVL